MNGRDASVVSSALCGQLLWQELRWQTGIGIKRERKRSLDAQRTSHLATASSTLNHGGQPLQLGAGGGNLELPVDAALVRRLRAVAWRQPDSGSANMNYARSASAFGLTPIKLPLTNRDHHV